MLRTTHFVLCKEVWSAAQYGISRLSFVGRFVLFQSVLYRMFHYNILYEDGEAFKYYFPPSIANQYHTHT